MAERAVVDFQRGWWTSKGDNMRGTSAVNLVDSERSSQTNTGPASKQLSRSNAGSIAPLVRKL